MDSQGKEEKKGEQQHEQRSVDINRGYILNTFLINLALGNKVSLLKKKNLLLDEKDLQELNTEMSYIIDVKIGV